MSAQKRTTEDERTLKRPSRDLHKCVLCHQVIEAHSMFLVKTHYCPT